MAFDPATGQLILFGGADAGSNLNDTWNWDGTTWTQLTPANSPSIRGQAAMAFDAATGQLILFGGLMAVHFLTIRGIGMEQIGLNFRLPLRLLLALLLQWPLIQPLVS